MAQKKIIPYRHLPRGVSDTLDGTNSPPGAMASLVNLIFDPSTPNTFQCRPAAIQKTAFSGFTSPGFVSVYYIVGNYAYGMVATTRNAGQDEPFAYDLVNNVFLPITGTISGATTPTSPATTGDWTPPTMSLMGSLLVVTHPGFAGGAGAYFGWFDITTPTAPVWHAGNTTGNALPGVPTCAVQFNNRTYFAIGSSVYYTDALTLNLTSANQFVTFGDTNAIVAMCPIPFFSSSQGGILQSILLFKQAAIAQILGDAVGSTLSMNVLNTGIGTKAPRSVVSTPYGVAFAAADGIRIVQQTGQLTDPDDNLRIPFLYAVTPSRMSAAYNNGVYRVCVQNGKVTGQPYQEYWFDSLKAEWTGPHSFRQDMAYPWSNTFVIFNGSVTGKLFVSDVIQSSSSSFTENGSALTFTYLTAPLSDSGSLYETEVVLSTVDMSLPTDGSSYSCAAIDTISGTLNTVSVKSASSGVLWGFFTWGVGVWSALLSVIRSYIIPWTVPLVFNRLQIQVSGNSSLSLKIGKMTVGYRLLNYIRYP